MQVLCQICFINIFSNLWLTFSFFNAVFQEANIINFDGLAFIDFSFIVCVFYAPSKKSLPNFKAQRYSPAFSSEANNLK